VLQVAGIERREDFYRTLAAVFMIVNNSTCTIRHSTFSGATHRCRAGLALLLPKMQVWEDNRRRIQAAIDWPRRSRPSTHRLETKRRAAACSRDRGDLHGIGSRADAQSRLRDHDR
jgi:hypothetical protein